MQRGPGLEKSEVVLAVVDRADPAELGQPGGETLGWRTERNHMGRQSDFQDKGASG